MVAPDQLKMPADIVARLRSHGVPVEETPNLEAALAKADVLYMTRIQKERFADPAEYERLKGSYILTREMIERRQARTSPSCIRCRASTRSRRMWTALPERGLLPPGRATASLSAWR